VRRIILELGLRYRPASADQLEAHQAKLAALIADLADLPPAMLERAASHWVRQSAFMPKASDLVALARNFASAERGSPMQRLDVAALRNARMAEEPGGRRDVRWVDDGHGLRLVGLARSGRAPDPPPSGRERSGVGRRDSANAEAARDKAATHRPPAAPAIPTPLARVVVPPRHDWTVRGTVHPATPLPGKGRGVAASDEAGVAKDQRHGG
jgi:hypothetical protein